MKPVLSVCIASYNKAEITSGLVKSILTNKNNELEVVVVDNASSDATISMLSSIDDDRLKIIKNEKNIGYGSNLVKSLFEASGDFCFYTNDRDIVFPEKLDEFIDFLKDNSEIGGGHCVRHLIKDKGKSVEYCGKEALWTINFRGEHPTGFFFKRLLLDQIPQKSVELYASYDRFFPFPYENFLCEIICRGYKVVQYNSVIWESTGNTTSKNYVSASDNLDVKEDRWFSPNNSMRRAIGNVEDTLRICQENGLVLTKEEKYKLYSHILIPQYVFGVYRYKVICETPFLAYHYKMACRKVSKEECAKNKQLIIDGFINYIRGSEGEDIILEQLILKEIERFDNEQSRRKKYSLIYRFLRKFKFIKRIR